MTKLFKAAALLGALLFAAPAFAQVAVVDLEAAIANSNAYKTAQTQIQTTYKAQIDATRTRQQAINSELQPLAREIQTLQGNTATPPATLQSKVQAFEARRQSAARELATLSASYSRPNAYAQSQVADKVEAALRAAMNAKRVTVVVNPQAAILALPAADITADVTTQLNSLVTQVSVTPPANWQPGQPSATAPAAPQGR
jgi:Skp family chaperone for outer membrane proteins